MSKHSGRPRQPPHIPLWGKTWSVVVGPVSSLSMTWLTQGHSHPGPWMTRERPACVQGLDRPAPQGDLPHVLSRVLFPHEFLAPQTVSAADSQPKIGISVGKSVHNYLDLFLFYHLLRILAWNKLLCWLPNGDFLLILWFFLHLIVRILLKGRAFPPPHSFISLIYISMFSWILLLWVIICHLFCCSNCPSFSQ